MHPCMAGACCKRRRHGRGALCAALLVGSDPSAWSLPDLNGLRAVLCCGSSASGGRMHCTVADRACILYVTVRALAEIEPGGPAPAARQSETSRRAASRTDGSQMCVNAVQRRQSAKTFLLRDTSTVHLQRWRQMDEFAIAPLCVLKMATNKRANLQTVCINFWTSKQS